MQKPDRSKIRYNEAAIKQASKRRVLPHGWHPFIVAETGESIASKEKTMGNMVLENRCAALKIRHKRRARSLRRCRLRWCLG